VPLYFEIRVFGRLKVIRWTFCPKIVKNRVVRAIYIYIVLYGMTIYILFISEIYSSAEENQQFGLKK